MSATQTQPMTVLEFERLSDGGLRRELVHGEVHESRPPGGLHGAIAVALALMLRLWARSAQGGYVGVEAGYVLRRNPDTVRGPDVSYVRAERIPDDGVPEGFRCAVRELFG